MKIDICGNTDIGRKRQFNEDSYLLLDLSRAGSQGSNSTSLIAVADGIGGHVGGDMASSLAVETIKEKIAGWAETSRSSYQDARVLEESIQLANRRIYEKASSDSEFTGMGTTIVTALISGDWVTVSNVGDSRAYMIRDGSIKQISRDHSWKAEQQRLKVLSEKEIQESPFKHTITRSLGFEADVQVDTFQIEIRGGDYLLLCSDGLYDSIPDGLMLKIVKKNKSLSKICQKLIKEANKHGGQDNITAVLASIKGTVKPGSRQKPSDTVKLDDHDRKVKVSDTVLLPDPDGKP